jgi:anti-sigma regulatory factor (Ser/Thr protein kinase)
MSVEGCASVSCAIIKLEENMAHNDQVMVAIRLPSHSLYISVARAATRSFSSLIPLTEEERGMIELAVGEACDNAVRYCDSDADFFEVRLQNSDSDLIIEVSNSGSCFIPERPAAMPDVFAENGRGLALMEYLMDDVEFLPEKDRTTVRMRKALSR